MQGFLEGVAYGQQVYSAVNAEYPFGVIALLWVAVWASIRVLNAIYHAFKG